MLSEFQEFIRLEELITAGDRVLLAVSGGMDSVTMAELFHRSAYPFGIAHCNFSLRKDESDREEEFVRTLAARYGVPFHVIRFDTKTYALEKGLSIQMAARELRYEWFLRLLDHEGYDAVATAHHRDDQVESFLINLSRGTGLAGLHGILPKNGRIIRPLLFSDREMIRNFVRDENLAYMEDSSNNQIKYLRNRIRHRILPEMEKMMPGFRRNVLQTICQVRQAEIIYRQAIAEMSGRLMSIGEEEIRIDKTALKQLHPLNTWIFELLRPYGFHSGLCEQISVAISGEPGRIFQSNSFMLLIDREELILKKQEDNNPDVDAHFLYSKTGQISIPLEMSWAPVDPGQIAFSSDPGTAFLDLDRLSFPLEIRKWRRGDFFIPLGMDGKKKISDYFIDRKLSRFEKQNTWLLCSGGQVAWIIGHRLDERFRIRPETLRALKVHRLH